MEYLVGYKAVQRPSTTIANNNSSGGSRTIKYDKETIGSVVVSSGRIVSSGDIGSLSGAAQAACGLSNIKEFSVISFSLINGATMDDV